MIAMKLFARLIDSSTTEAAVLPSESAPDRILASLWRDVMLFFVVSWLDVLMTYWLLTHHSGRFFESNPAADLVRSQWGFAGMVGYKFLLVGIVVMNSFIIVRYRPDIARRLIQFATLVVNAVVIYSLILLLKHG